MMCPLHGSHPLAAPATHPAGQPPKNADLGSCCKETKAGEEVGGRGARGAHSLGHMRRQFVEECAPCMALSRKLAEQHIQRDNLPKVQTSARAARKIAQDHMQHTG